VRDAGMSYDTYRHEIHDQIVIQKLQQHEVAGKVSVTPEEINSYLKAAVSKDTGISEYRINDILIPVSDSPSATELNAAKERAQAVYNKLQSGSPVSNVTQLETKQANPIQTNDLGWRKLNEVPTAFADRVNSMQKNDLAAPIQTPNGFHILHMTDVRKIQNGRNMPTDRKSVEVMLLQQKFEVAVQSWMSKLRSTAFITTDV
jgi:peptidyl-prolyl cis-trans isomerase SurA